MKTERFRISSAVDGLPLSVLLTVPDDDHVKAVFQIAHGMAEYKDRYLPLMEYLCARGYACVIHDHRGHGESVYSKDDYGFLYEDGANAMVDDLHEVTRFAKERFPRIPLVLMGHSMGSMIVRSYLKEYDDEIAGLVVSGSSSYNPIAGIGSVLASVIGVIHGQHYRSNFLQNLSIGAFNKKFPETNNAWLSVNQDNVAAYNADERCGFVFTTNGFKALCGLMKDSYSKTGWKLKHAELPIVFLSGEDDPSMVDQNKFLFAVDFLKQRGYRNVTYKLYKGKRHELMNEDDKEEFFADNTAFADKAITQ